MAKSFEKDLTQGNLFKQIFFYALPIIAVNLLQVLFNSVDVAVLGWFVDDTAVGAVGVTGSVINLFIVFFVGISIGASVCVGRSVGRKDKEEAERFVSTCVIFGILSGVVIAIVGIILARTMLTWVNCDPVLLDDATKYLRIYFVGMPIIMFYNYAASILRAVGDTKSPLIFLAISGVANIGLNVFFITVFGMDVDGVAIATVISQAITGVCSFVLLVKRKGYSRLNIKRFRIYKKELGTLLYIGIPSGLQKLFYGISNTVVASAINFFGETVTTANTIATQVESVLCETTEGFSIASLSFVSQNHGSRNYKRIKQSILVCCFYIIVLGAVLALLTTVFGKSVCRLIFTQDEEILEMAQVKFDVISFAYILYGIMNTLSYSLRGLGKSVLGMITGLSSGCVLRITYVKIVQAVKNTLGMVYSAYVVCWAVGIVINLVFLIYAIKKTRKEDERTLIGKEIKE